MSIRDQYDFSSLVNEKENWIIGELDNQLRLHPDVCTCSECVLDMTALALNHTKPNYRVTLLGAIYAMAEDDVTKAEIQTAVENAITQVHKNPACEKQNT